MTELWSNARNTRKGLRVLDAVCPTCGKRFKAPEKLAGKKVRCRGCEGMFALPTVAGAPAMKLETSHREVNLSFQDDEHPSPQPSRSVDRDDVPSVFRNSGLDAAGFERHDQDEPETLSASSTALAGPGDVGGDYPPTSAPAPAARSGSAWFWHPQVVLLDRWLPRVSVGIGALWLLLSMSSSLQFNESPFWIWVARLGVAVAGFMALVVPLSHVGIRIAASQLHKALPKTAVWRTLASFTPAAVVSIAIWNAGGGWSVMVVMGLILGLAVGAAMVLLLFRLRPEETGVYAAWSCGGFVVGMLIAGSVVYVGNTLVVKSLSAAPAEKLAGLPLESPLWSNLAWPEKPAPAPVPTVVKKSAPSPSAPVKQPVGVPVDASQATGPHPGEAVAPQQPAAPTLSASRSEPAKETVSPPTQSPNVFDVPGVTPPAPAIPSTPPTAVPSNPAASNSLPPASPPGGITARAELLPSSPSALKDGQSWYDQLGEFEAVVHPALSSGTGNTYALLVRPRRGDEVVLECFNSRTWTSLGLTSRSDRGGPVSGSASTSYAISPDGRVIAQLISNPKPAVRFWERESGSSRDPVELSNLNLVSAELLGFYRGTTLLLRGKDREGVTLLASCNATQAKLIASLGKLPNEGQAGAMVSVGGAGTNPAVVATVSNRENQMGVTVYPLESVASPSGRDYARNIGSMPAAFACSPDSKRLAIFYKAGGGNLLVYSLDANAGTPTPTTQREYPRCPIGTYPERYDSSPLAFSPSGKWLLLYGDAIVDTASGEVLDRLGIPGVVSHRVVSDDAVDLVVEAGGARKITRVMLNKPKLLDAMKAAGSSKQ